MGFDRLKTFFVKANLIKSDEKLKVSENLCCKCKQSFPKEQFIRYKRFQFCRKCYRLDRIKMLIVIIGIVIALFVYMLVVQK